MKLILWKEKIICGQYDTFEHEQSFASLQKDQITDISKLMQNHLQPLRDLLKNYSPNLNEFDYKLICKTFGVDPRLFPHSLQDEFLNFSIIQQPKITLNSHLCSILVVNGKLISIGVKKVCGK